MSQNHRWPSHLKFWKTIVVNGQYEEKHSMEMVQWQQNHWKTIESNGAPENNHYHPFVLKKLPLLKSNPHKYGSKPKIIVDYESGPDQWSPMSDIFHRIRAISTQYCANIAICSRYPIFFKRLIIDRRTLLVIKNIQFLSNFAPFLIVFFINLLK